MNANRLLPLVIVVQSALLPVRAEDTARLASVMNGVGGMSTNTLTLGGETYRHMGSGAQPGGIGRGGGGTFTNLAGFLQAADVKKPGLDTDGDGIPDELDPDNDEDALADADEVGGAAFMGWATSDPNDPDTDGDGMTDDAEAAGQYDPRDPLHRLGILRYSIEGGLHTLVWVGKGGGRTNAVLSGSNLMAGPPSDLLHQATYAGGTAPWFKATNTHTWADSGSNAVFRLRTDP